MTALTYEPATFAGSSAISTTIIELGKVWRERILPAQQRTRDACTWLTDVTMDASYATEFDLKRFAYQRVAGLKATGDYVESDTTRGRLKEVLSGLLEDGGPTPQVGATPDRAVEVQWLCEGTLVSAIIEHDGEVSIFAEDSTSRPIFDFEFAQDQPVSRLAAEQARDLLRKMAVGVKQRPFDWHRTR